MGIPDADWQLLMDNGMSGRNLLDNGVHREVFIFLPPRIHLGCFLLPMLFTLTLWLIKTFLSLSLNLNLSLALRPPGQSFLWTPTKLVGSFIWPGEYAVLYILFSPPSDPKYLKGRHWPCVPHRIASPPWEVNWYLVFKNEQKVHPSLTEWCSSDTYWAVCLEQRIWRMKE